MPAGLVKSLADRYHCSRATVEAAWRACKGAIHPKSSGQDGYGVVVNCVKAKLSKRSEGKAKKTYAKNRKATGG